MRRATQGENKTILPIILLSATETDARQTDLVSVSCHSCGKTFSRQLWRIQRFVRQFCSQKCYHSVRQDGRYKQWRQGQRRARQIVSKYFPLKSEHIVHHEDRDNGNNSLPNLRVFASQADHMAYHHGVTKVVPIWDGRSVTP